jgi:hypothetical protein
LARKSSTLNAVFNCSSIYVISGRLDGELQGKLMCTYGVLVSPPGEFVSRQMIPCSMGRGRSRMGVGCEVVQFRGSIVYALRHGVPDLKRIARVRVRLPALPPALAVRRTAPLFSGR